MTDAERALMAEIERLELLIGEYGDLVGTCEGVLFTEGSEIDEEIRRHVDKYRASDKVGPVNRHQWIRKG